MKVHYTGKLEHLDAESQKKLDARIARLSKLIDRRSEKEAHVVLTSERHLRRAEISVNFYDHPLAGIHSSPDAFTSLTGALDKLEKQILKLHDKRIANKRRAGKSVPRVSEEALPPASPRVYRVTPARKPMTLDEAALLMDGKRNYVVYRDAESDRLSVLFRRADGHFDLIEA